MAWAVSGGHANQRLLDSGSKLFGAYDRFLALVQDEGDRERLKSLLPSEAAADSVYNEGRAIATLFQEALDEIFLVENGTDFPRLTRTYGVF